MFNEAVASVLQSAEKRRPRHQDYSVMSTTMYGYTHRSLDRNTHLPRSELAYICDVTVN